MTTNLSLNLIPDFIASDSPKGLRRLMIKTNARDGVSYNYFDIQNVDGKWYAWFYREAKRGQSLLSEKQ